MRLEQMLDQRHALYRLSGKIDWSAAETRFGGRYAEEKAAPASPSGPWWACTTSNTPFTDRMKRAVHELRKI